MRRGGEKGYAVEYRCSLPPDPVKVAKAKAEAIELERQITKQRRRLARWLWRRLIDRLSATWRTRLRRRRYPAIALRC